MHKKAGAAEQISETPASLCTEIIPYSKFRREKLFCLFEFAQQTRTVNSEGIYCSYWYIA